MEIQVGDSVTFIDKTKERLTGKVTKIGALGNPNTLVVDCFKKSWDMEISCMVPKSRVTKVTDYTQKLYEAVGPSAVYDYANEMNIGLVFCEPCDAATPSEGGECLMCGTPNKKD